MIWLLPDYYKGSVHPLKTAVHYTIIRQNDPNNPGIYRYRARAVPCGETTMDDIVWKLELGSTLSVADIEAVIYGLACVLSDARAWGQIVGLGRLDDFRLTLRGSSQDSEGDVTSQSLTPRVHFAPGEAIKKKMRSVAFKKTAGIRWWNGHLPIHTACATIFMNYRSMP